MTEIEKIYLRERVKMQDKCDWKGISKDDAEDIIQDAFVEAFEKTQDPEEFEKLFWKRFYCKISANDYEHKRYRKAKEMLNSDDELETEMLPDGDNITEQPRFDVVEEDKSDGMAATLELEEEILMDSLDKMPENVAETMYLRFIEHLSVEEIATELKLSRNSVNMYLVKGRKMLKNE